VSSLRESGILPVPTNPIARPSYFDTTSLQPRSLCCSMVETRKERPSSESWVRVPETVGTAVGRSLSDLVKIINRITGNDIQTIYIPARDVRIYYGDQPINARVSIWIRERLDNEHRVLLEAGIGEIVKLRKTCREDSRGGSFAESPAPPASPFEHRARRFRAPLHPGTTHYLPSPSFPSLWRRLRSIVRVAGLLGLALLRRSISAKASS